MKWEVTIVVWCNGNSGVYVRHGSAFRLDDLKGLGGILNEISRDFEKDGIHKVDVNIYPTSN